MPVCRGLPLFSEARPLPPGSLASWLSGLEDMYFLADQEYRDFLKLKKTRGQVDLYAAFQPFNESTRAIYPFIPLLKKVLQPGDVILDTWCRTGWSGELLAGLFPEQQVISLWEGNSNVLGYRGFDYWLGSRRRAPNLDIVFSHPGRALPIQTGAVSLVHGLDSLHRYNHLSFIPEILRVCRNDGVLLFPHIHLSNTEPDPFFERGCHQYHGREWKAWLDQLLRDSSRSSWLLPEVSLFALAEPLPLKDDSETAHYNGLLMIGPRELEGSMLQPGNEWAFISQARFIKNPLLDINLSTCEVRLSPTTLSGRSQELLQRHPCYLQRLEHCGATLSTDESLFIWYAAQNLSLSQIAVSMELPLGETRALARQLCGREILHPAVISPAMSTLQHYHGFGSVPEWRPQSFAELWEHARQHYGSRRLLRWLADDSCLTFGEADFIIEGIRRRLHTAGIRPGDRVAILSQHHPEALLVVWAAWLGGMTIVPLDPELPGDGVEQLLGQSEAKLLFTDRSELRVSPAVPVVLLDDAAAAFEATEEFSVWVAEALDGSPLSSESNPDITGTILFTSGSTGEPKGVMLSQRALCNSGWEMAEHYGWTSSDTLLSLGPLSMMSGLRNTCLAALFVGSTILVPDPRTNRHPLMTWAQGATAGVSVITTVPAWLQVLISRGDIPPSEQLRQILVTGATLHSSLQEQAEKILGYPIADYYGLTETGGICCAPVPGQTEAIGTLGVPTRNALVQIVDNCGKVAGRETAGTIRVRSTQLMSGYLNNEAASQAVFHDGWLWTGDHGRWDASGHLVLLGREDDAIKLRDGSRFYPQHLEELLSSLEDVSDAAVSLGGNPGKLTALIVAARPLEAVRQEFMARHGLSLPARQIPEVWCQPASLPRNSNGKLRRGGLSALINDLI
ncbi:class I adenylate-forming enzyme family protein [Porticoccus sp.]|uniref:class I adenylate-forming enzyme family protein n=1 Tax=Porticoccus sp. TaxID=2024853 RepID=UPI003F697B02